VGVRLQSKTANRGRRVGVDVPVICRILSEQGRLLLISDSFHPNIDTRGGSVSIVNSLQADRSANRGMTLQNAVFCDV
jgi:hypothetical protein